MVRWNSRRRSARRKGSCHLDGVQGFLSTHAFIMITVAYTTANAGLGMSLLVISLTRLFQMPADLPCFRYSLKVVAATISV